MASGQPAASGVRRKRKAALDSSPTLESIIGHTVTHASALAVNPVTEEIAYSAGCVAVLYSVAKHRQVRFFRASKGISCLGFSRDGRYLAVGERGKEPASLVWDLGDGRIVGELKGHKYGLSCLAFSPKAPSKGGPPILVTVGFRHDRLLLVWDVASGAKLAVSRVIHKVHAIDFSEDGAFFVTCGERHIKFWPMVGGGPSNKGGHELPVLADPSPEVMDKVPVLSGAAASIVDSHRGASFLDVACGTGRHRDSIYAVTSQGTLCVFSRSFLMEQWMTLEATTAYAVTCVGDHVVVGCPHGLVRVFDAEGLRYVATLPRPACLVPSGLPPSEAQYPAAMGLRPLPNGRQLAAVYADRSLLVWDVASWGHVSLQRALVGHSACVWDAQFVPHNDVNARATRREGGPTRSGDTVRGETVLGEEEGEGEGEWGVEGGALVTCSADDSIRFWRLGREVGPPLQSVCMDQGGTGDGDSDMAHALRAARAVMAEGTSESEIPSRPESRYSPRCLAVHPRGHEVAAGDREGNLRVYNINGGRPKLLALRPAHDAEVLTLDYSPDTGGEGGGGALLASGGRDRLVHVFDPTRKYARLSTLENHSSSITAVKFSRDGTQLLSCGGDRALVLSAVDGKKVSRVKSVAVPSGTVYDIDVDPTNKYMITSGQDRRVNIWEVRSGKHIRSYRPEGPSGELYKVALDPSGMFAATCSFDKLVRVFDFFSGAAIAKVSGHSEVVTAVRFSPDGRRLVSVGGDGIIFVWRLPSDMTRAMFDRLAELSASPPPMGPPLPPPESIVLANSPPRPCGREAGGQAGSRGEHKGEGKVRLQMHTGDLPAWARDRGGRGREKGGGEEEAGAVELDMQTKDLPKWAQGRKAGAGVGEEEEEEREGGEGGLSMKTSDLPAWARRGAGSAVSSKMPSEEYGRDEGGGKWAARLQEEKGEMFGGEKGDRRKLTVEGEEGLWASGEVEEEGGFRTAEQGTGGSDEVDLSLVEEEPLGGVVEAVDEEEEEEGEGDGRLLAATLRLMGPGEDGARLDAGAFSVRRSREGGLLLHLGEEEGSVGGKGGFEEEEGYVRRDEEAGQWLRQALRDASPIMGQEGEGFAMDPRASGRQSFSTTFFRAKGGGIGQASEGEGEEGGQAAQDRPPPVSPLPASPLAGSGQGGDGPGPSGRSQLEQEREALKLKLRRKRETVERVAQMQEDLRKMGILRSPPSQAADPVLLTPTPRTTAGERPRNTDDGGPRNADAPAPASDPSPLKRDPTSSHPFPHVLPHVHVLEGMADQPPAPPTLLPPPPPASEDSGSALRHVASSSSRHRHTSSGGGNNGVLQNEIVAPSHPPVVGAAKEGGGPLGLLGGRKEATLKATMGAEGDTTGLGDEDFFDFAAPKTGEEPKRSGEVGGVEGEGTGAPVVGGLKSLFSPSFRSAAAAREASHAAGLGKQVAPAQEASITKPQRSERAPSQPPAAVDLGPQEGPSLSAPPLGSLRPTKEGGACLGLGPQGLGAQEGLRVEVGTLGSSLLSNGVQATPRPLHDYYAALSELDGAARRAMALYRELSTSSASLASARLSVGPPSSDMRGPLSDMRGGGGGPVEEVLGSFRCSFAGLSSAVHTLAAELQDEELRSSFAASQPGPSLPGHSPSTDRYRSSTGGGGSGSGNPFAHVLQTSAPHVGDHDAPPSHASSLGPTGGREAFSKDGGWAPGASSNECSSMGQGAKLATATATASASASGPPAELLEKYSDMLMKLVERKVDDMLLSKSQTRL